MPGEELVFEIRRAHNCRLINLLLKVIFVGWKHNSPGYIDTEKKLRWKKGTLWFVGKITFNYDNNGGNKVRKISFE